MTHEEKTNAMIEFEVAVNKLTRILQEHEEKLCGEVDVEQWHYAYEAKKLAESLTWTKLAISHMLDESIKAVK